MAEAAGCITVRFPLFSPAKFKWTVEVVVEQTGKMGSRKSAEPEGFMPAFRGNSRMRLINYEL